MQNLYSTLYDSVLNLKFKKKIEKVNDKYFLIL